MDHAGHVTAPARGPRPGCSGFYPQTFFYLILNSATRTAHRTRPRDRPDRHRPDVLVRAGLAAARPGPARTRRATATADYANRTGFGTIRGSSLTSMSCHAHESLIAEVLLPGGRAGSGPTRCPALGRTIAGISAIASRIGGRLLSAHFGSVARWSFRRTKTSFFAQLGGVRTNRQRGCDETQCSRRGIVVSEPHASLP